MANVGNLNNNLNELVKLEKDLWEAFKKAEKEYTPPTFRLISAFNNTLNFISQKRLKKRYNYPIFLLLTALCAIGTILLSQWLLIPYLVFLILTIVARKKYVYAYAVDKLGTQNFTQFGFGLNHLSLVVVGVIKLKDAGGAKLTKESISSIVKIVKARQELSDVSFGVEEHLKKVLYAAPIPIVYFALKNHQVISEYTTAFSSVINKSIVISAILLSIAIGVTAFCYDLLIGQTLAKYRKKEYLLVLNIISESFTK